MRVYARAFRCRAKSAERDQLKHKTSPSSVLLLNQYSRSLVLRGLPLPSSSSSSTDHTTHMYIPTSNASSVRRRRRRRRGARREEKKKEESLSQLLCYHPLSLSLSLFSISNVSATHTSAVKRRPLAKGTRALHLRSDPHCLCFRLRLRLLLSQSPSRAAASQRLLCA